MKLDDTAMYVKSIIELGNRLNILNEGLFLHVICISIQ